MRGRKRKPTVLKLVEGNPGKRPLNRNEPQPGPLGEPPPLVRGRPSALAKWNELISQECWGPVVTRADADALEAYCLLYARMAEAEEKIARFGMMVKSPQGFPVQSPYVSIANRCREDMRKIASEFGGLPASRSRLSVKPRSKVEDEPQDYFA